MPGFENVLILKDVCTTVVNTEGSFVLLPFSLLWLSFFKCWCVYRTVCARRSDLVGFAPPQQVSMPAEVAEELWYKTFMMDGHYGYCNFDIMRQSINRKTHFVWVLHHPSWARCALIKVFLLSRGPPFREDAGTRPRLESNILASPLMWASEVQNVLEMEMNSNSSCIEKKQLQFFFSLRLTSSRLQKTKNHAHVLSCTSTWPGVKPANVCAQYVESSLWLKAEADIHIFSLKSWNLNPPPLSLITYSRALRLIFQEVGPCSPAKVQAWSCICWIHLPPLAPVKSKQHTHFLYICFNYRRWHRSKATSLWAALARSSTSGSFICLVNECVMSWINGFCFLPRWSPVEA